jgi:hypothetical protein
MFAAADRPAIPPIRHRLIDETDISVDRHVGAIIAPKRAQT